MQGKLTEATRRIKDLQREADVATRDKINAQRRTDVSMMHVFIQIGVAEIVCLTCCQALEKKSAELEVQLLRATGASSPSGKGVCDVYAT